MEITKCIVITGLQMAFNAFDPDKTGIIKTDQVSVMFQMMGLDVKSAALNPVIAEVDTFGNTKSQIYMFTYFN